MRRSIRAKAFTLLCFVSSISLGNARQDRLPGTGNVTSTQAITTTATSLPTVRSTPYPTMPRIAVEKATKSITALPLVSHTMAPYSPPPHAQPSRYPTKRPTAPTQSVDTVKNTDKTNNPQIINKITASPTIAKVPPTKSPTREPTFTPTKPPTVTPTTTKPTTAPTVTVVQVTEPPTLSPTPLPEAAVTASEVLNKTSSPVTAAPTPLVTNPPSTIHPASLIDKQAEDQRVILPDVQVDLQMKPGQSINNDSIKKVVQDFVVQTIVSTNGNALESPELQTVLGFNQSSGIARIDVEGYAQPKANVTLTEQDVDDSLMTYFKFFGLQDLSEYLVKANVAAQSLSVKIGNVTMGPVSVDNSTQSDSSSLVTDPYNNSQSSGSNSISLTALVVSVSAIALIVVLIGTIMLIRQRRQSKQKGPVIVMDLAPNDTEASSPRDLLAETAPPPLPYSPAPSDIILNDDVRSYSGLVSLEDSLFTTDNSLLRAQPSAYQYDASRLDQVIISAKGLSKQLDESIKAEENDSAHFML